MTRTVLRALMLVLAVAAPASAQIVRPGASRVEWQFGDGTFLLANVALGAATAALLDALHDGPARSWEAIRGGAVGGAVAYAGKRVSAAHFDGAGLLGRELAAVGGSVVRNAGERRPLLSRLTLPVGPANLHLARGDSAGFRLKPDLAALLWVAYAVARPDLDFDAARSFSAGAPVFRGAVDAVFGSDGSAVLGAHAGGVVFLSDAEGRTPHDSRAVFAHERTHVLQADLRFALWNAPFEAWLARRFAPLGRVHEHVDLDLLPTLAADGLLWLAGIDAWSLPREWEAEAFAGH